MKNIIEAKVSISKWFTTNKSSCYKSISRDHPLSTIDPLITQLTSLLFPVNQLDISSLHQLFHMRHVIHRGYLMDVSLLPFSHVWMLQPTFVFSVKQFTFLYYLTNVEHL